MNKILIVDDNFPDRELLKEILLSSGQKYDIHLAESGQKSLDIISETPPDLILLDIQMKGKSGFDVLRELNEVQKKFIPVLLVSSFTGEDDRIKGLELGATDFINKPIISEEVKARVAVQMKIKKMYDDIEWASQKTNDGIKLLYKEIERKNQDLKKLDKLKSDFVSTVSHELRTPLAITTEGLSLLLDRIPGEINEKQKGILKSSKDNVDRLSRIINDLLDISKIEAGKVELRKSFTDFTSLLTNFMDSYQTVVKSKKITMSAQLPTQGTYLFIDRDKLLQVISNLLNNAYKFTDVGGRIEVKYEAKESQVLCSVSDNGHGMSEEDMGNLFQKFHQFSRKEGPGMKGTGLGLAITKALIELHEGKIWAESQLGKGTTFFFTLPLYEHFINNFDNYFSEKLKEYVLEQKSCGLIIANLKNFDEINQRYQSDFSIDVMNKIYSKIEKTISHPGDRALLYDPKNIYIFLPETDKVGAATVARRIKSSVQNEEFHYEGEKVSVELALGTAVSPIDGTERSKLVEIAQKNCVKSKRVLVVDDHPQIMRLIEMRLETGNFEILSAETGEEAIEVAINERLDLIILDVFMPDMNGYEVYGRLKENPKTVHVPVILLAAKDPDLYKIEALTTGAIQVVEKTGGFDSVMHAINDIL